MITNDGTQVVIPKNSNTKPQPGITVHFQLYRQPFIKQQYQSPLPFCPHSAKAKSNTDETTTKKNCEKQIYLHFISLF
jgi:hypothetical protein